MIVFSLWILDGIAFLDKIMILFQNLFNIALLHLSADFSEINTEVCGAT